MPPRHGSLKTPLLAAFVFCIGVGLGVGWKLGWIPLNYRPAAAGTLEESDQTTVEDDAASADDDALAAEDNVPPAWAAAQGEPPVEVGTNRKAAFAEEAVAAVEPPNENPPHVRPAKSQASAATKKPRRVHLIPERVQQANLEVEADDAPPPAKPRFAPADREETSPPADPDRFAAGEFLAAHKLLSKLYWSAKAGDDELEQRLEASAKKIFFSPQPHFIEPYVIQPGDQLQRVARKYQLSWEYVATLNQTDPRRIREGQKLKVLKGPFAAIVSLHDFALTIHLQGYYVKRYPVCIGKDGSSPVGKFTVLDKLVNPQYTDPDGKVIEGGDPTNPLGKFWIDLGDSYGIHGTIEPDSIGTAASRGCIRLCDDDIREVYNFLVKDSVVEIRE